jgi:uncharacterized membrane protein
VLIFSAISQSIMHCFHFRLAQIPVAYLLCPNEIMPDFYSVMGMLFILSSSMVGDWLLYLEERSDYEEIPSTP